MYAERTGRAVRGPTDEVVARDARDPTRPAFDRPAFGLDQDSASSSTKSMLSMPLSSVVTTPLFTRVPEVSKVQVLRAGPGRRRASWGYVGVEASGAGVVDRRGGRHRRIGRPVQP